MELFVMVYVVGQICEGGVDAFGAVVFFGVGVEEGGEEFCFAVGAVLARVEFVAAHFYLVVGVEETLTLFLGDRVKLKNFCTYHQANDQTSVLSTEKVQKSQLGPKLWVFEKKFPQKQFFLGYPLSKFDEIKKFKKQAHSQKPELYPEF